MDLTEVLLRGGASRPHVLIATMPGGTAVRLAVEEGVRRRGWPVAMTPADADVLFVAGRVTVDFDELLEEVWRGMPAPRDRVHTVDPDEVSGLLGIARSGLMDRTRQQSLAALSMGDTDRLQRQGKPHGATASEETKPDPADLDHASDESSDHDGHGHDMGGMEMPAGLPMADRAEDRDGLKLDQLHVPFGPIMPDWPTGLVVHLTLQGDVIQDSHIEAIGAGAGSFWTEPWQRSAVGERVSTAEGARRRAGARLDSLGRFLAVAGWDDAATMARRLRDDALGGTQGPQLKAGLERLSRRVARSRTLGLLTRGLGEMTADEPIPASVSSRAPRLEGDVVHRYRRWCTDLTDMVARLDDGSPLDAATLEPPRNPLDVGDEPSASLFDVLPRLLDGAELGSARLIVASVDPDLDQRPARIQASHGR